jgi:replication factor A1
MEGRDGTTVVPGEGTETRLKDLRANGPPVAIIAKVVSAQHREIVLRSDGSRRPVLSGLLSDGTATIRFTWWDPPREGVDRGTVLRAVNVGVQEYRGRMELTFNWKSRVEPASVVELPTLGLDEVPKRELSQLGPSDEGFRIEARVLSVRPKIVTVAGERRSIHEGTLIDGSGTLAFTSWTDLGLQPGEAVRLWGGYVRTFQGRTQLTLDERTRVDRFDGAGLPAPSDGTAPPLRRLADLERTGGGDYLSVEGLVVGLMPPSGVIYRCPTCRRVLREGTCRTHGIVTGEADLRARLVLDDGEGVATANLGRPETERLFGRTLPECLADLRTLPDPSRIEAQLFERTFGRRLRLEGRATKDDFGLTIFPDRIIEVSFDAPSSIRASAARLQEGSA